MLNSFLKGTDYIEELRQHNTRGSWALGGILYFIAQYTFKCKSLPLPFYTFCHAYFHFVFYLVRLFSVFINRDLRYTKKWKMAPETRWYFRLLSKTFRSMSMYLDLNRALKECVNGHQQIVEIMAWFLSGCKFRCRWGKEIKFEARGKSEDWGLLPFIANCRQLLHPGHWRSLFKKHFRSLFDLYVGRIKIPQEE